MRVTACGGGSWSTLRMVLMRAVRAGVGVVLAAGLAGGCASAAVPGGAAADPSGQAGPACGTAPTARPDGWSLDGVRILSVSAACLEYEVTNRSAETADLTVLFGWSGRGERLSFDPTAVRRAVPPGATVTGSLVLSGREPQPQRPFGSPRPAPTDRPRPGPLPRARPAPTEPGPAARRRRPRCHAASATPSGPPAAAPGVKVLRVRSVPTAEAPSAGGECPASGVRVYTDEGDAAMGLRAVGLHLVNCGTKDVVLDGYPQVQVLDEAHALVESVRVLKGGSAITTGTGADAPPRRFTVPPGGAASSALVWRNTTDLGSDPVNAPYVRVRATPDAAPVMVTPELDLGTTGKLGVGAWAPDKS